MRSELALERSLNAGTHFELLFELSHSSLGALWVGRASGGRDAGRPVVLRALSLDAPKHIETALMRASSIAHPRLLKTLGVTLIDGRAYLVSEHVDGLPLSELARSMRAAAVSMVPEVALRITLDALQAVAAARDELARFGLKKLPRCLYADTAWVASFGETLLSDVGIASELADAKDAQVDDVQAAGALLWELVSGTHMPGATATASLPGTEGVLALSPSPKPLVELVSRALTSDATRRFPNAESMADAIVSLPMHWLATDAEVRAAVELLTHSLPPSVREVDAAPSGEHEIDPWDTPTRSLRMRPVLPSRPPRAHDATTQRPPVPPRTSKPAKR